jgi:hypothetical protein
MTGSTPIELKRALTRDEARAFADRWLPARTGNEPLRLASFYTENVFYPDPAVPDGLAGREPLLAYFRGCSAASRIGGGASSTRRRWRAAS